MKDLSVMVHVVVGMGGGGGRPKSLSHLLYKGWGGVAVVCCCVGCGPCTEAPDQ
jgi:hypothetical protein